jgi:hypothetical protein
MAFGLGFRTLRSLCEGQSNVVWQKSKLTPALFKAHELPCFEWVAAHLKQHHALPQPETLFKAFPDTQEAATPEPSSYYVNMLEKSYYYSRINQANLVSDHLKTYFSGQLSPCFLRLVEA